MPKAPQKNIPWTPRCASSAASPHANAAHIANAAAPASLASTPGAGFAPEQEVPQGQRAADDDGHITQRAEPTEFDEACEVAAVDDRPERLRRVRCRASMPRPTYRARCRSGCRALAAAPRNLRFAIERRLVVADVEQRRDARRHDIGGAASAEHGRQGRHQHRGDQRVAGEHRRRRPAPRVARGSIPHRPTTRSTLRAPG